MTFGRYTTWADIWPSATSAEKKLKGAFVSGSICCLGSGTCPVEPANWNCASKARSIRAEVLNFFLLGGGPDCIGTDAGVALKGALIKGPLDLTDSTITANMQLENCRFQYPIAASRARWKGELWLKNCFLTGFSGLPPLTANGATIRGTADFIGSKFQNPDGRALDLQRTAIGGSLSLAKAIIEGDAILTSMKVGGQMDCEGAHFQQGKSFALCMQNVTIAEGFFLRNNVKISGDMNISAATVGELVDDVGCWPSDHSVALDGFTYGRITGSSPLRAKERLVWLSDKDTWKGQFYPQPYKQLANFLHQIGQDANTREVLYTLARKLGEHRRKELRREIIEAGQSTPRMGLAIAKSLLLGSEHISGALLRWAVGYGYKPFRSLAVLTGLIAAFWVLTLGAWHAGDFAPNSSIVLTSEDWAEYDVKDDQPEPTNPAGDWSENTIPGRDWDSFNSIAYAADVVIPIIDFGQTDAWAPSTTRGPAGVFLWWARWLFTLAGWIVTALGAAALTGIIRRE